VKPFDITITSLEQPTPVRADARRRGRWLRRGATAAAAAILFSAGVGAGIGFDRAGGLGALGPSVAVGGAEFDLIREAWDLLQDQYVGARDIDERELAHGAIEGMTEVLGDEGHTDFMDAEERALHGDSLSGTYVGIGISLTEADGRPRIDEVFPDGPAAQARLQPGDEIVAIDGTEVGSGGVEAVRDRVRGREGSSVTLRIARPGADQFDARLTRSSVDVPAVSWALVPGTRIADIGLRRFQTGAADELEAALAAAIEGGAVNLILDLRGNPGGYTGEALAIASQFLADGLVYTTEDAKGTVTEFTVDKAREATDLPLVVLVDRESASSAEIVAGALKDRGRATVVGEVTFGTGTVVGEYGLRDGSALRIGTVNWRTPNGTLIWHEGITPDEIVSLPADGATIRPERLRALSPADLAGSGDTQLLRAIELLTAGDRDARHR
jgi:carboxyl-terminal processing protease